MLASSVSGSRLPLTRQSSSTSATMAGARMERWNFGRLAFSFQEKPVMIDSNLCE